MELLIVMILIVGSFIVGIVGNVIASELYDSAPSLAHRLIEIAVGRLPEHDRARFREEWNAHIDECSSKLGKLWHAAGCLFGAHAVAKALARPQASKRTSGGQRVSPTTNKQTDDQNKSAQIQFAKDELEHMKRIAELQTFLQKQFLHTINSGPIREQILKNFRTYLS